MKNVEHLNLGTFKFASSCLYFKYLQLGFFLFIFVSIQIFYGIWKNQIRNIIKSCINITFEYSTSIFRVARQSLWHAITSIYRYNLIFIYLLPWFSFTPAWFLHEKNMTSIKIFFWENLLQSETTFSGRESNVSTALLESSDISNILFLFFFRIIC